MSLRRCQRGSWFAINSPIVVNSIIRLKPLHCWLLCFIFRERSPAPTAASKKLSWISSGSFLILCHEEIYYNVKKGLTGRIKRRIIYLDNGKDKNMKFSELKKILKNHGCYKADEGSNHEEWFSPITNKPFQVGRHGTQDVPKGTYHAILKQAGIKR